MRDKLREEHPAVFTVARKPKPRPSGDDLGGEAWRKVTHDDFETVLTNFDAARGIETPAGKEKRKVDAQVGDHIPVILAKALEFSFTACGKFSSYKFDNPCALPARTSFEI